MGERSSAIRIAQRFSRDIRRGGRDEIRRLQGKYGLKPTGTISTKLLQAISLQETGAPKQLVKEQVEKFERAVTKAQITAPSLSAKDLRFQGRSPIQVGSIPSRTQEALQSQRQAVEKRRLMDQIEAVGTRVDPRTGQSIGTIYNVPDELEIIRGPQSTDLGPQQFETRDITERQIDIGLLPVTSQLPIIEKEEILNIQTPSQELFGIRPTVAFDQFQLKQVTTDNLSPLVTGPGELKTRKSERIFVERNKDDQFLGRIEEKSFKFREFLSPTAKALNIILDPEIVSPKVRQRGERFGQKISDFGYTIATAEKTPVEYVQQEVIPLPIVEQTRKGLGVVIQSTGDIIKGSPGEAITEAGITATFAIPRLVSSSILSPKKTTESFIEFVSDPGRLTAQRVAEVGPLATAAEFEVLGRTFDIGVIKPVKGTFKLTKKGITLAGKGIKFTAEKIVQDTPLFPRKVDGELRVYSLRDVVETDFRQLVVSEGLNVLTQDRAIQIKESVPAPLRPFIKLDVESINFFTKETISIKDPRGPTVIRDDVTFTGSKSSKNIGINELETPDIVLVESQGKFFAESTKGFDAGELFARTPEEVNFLPSTEKPTTKVGFDFVRKRPFEFETFIDRFFTEKKFEGTGIKAETKPLRDISGDVVGTETKIDRFIIKDPQLFAEKRLVVEKGDVTGIKLEKGPVESDILKQIDFPQSRGFPSKFDITKFTGEISKVVSEGKGFRFIEVFKVVDGEILGVKAKKVKQPLDLSTQFKPRESQKVDTKLDSDIEVTSDDSVLISEKKPKSKNTFKEPSGVRVGGDTVFFDEVITDGPGSKGRFGDLRDVNIDVTKDFGGRKDVSRERKRSRNRVSARKGEFKIGPRFGIGFGKDINNVFDPMSIKDFERKPDISIDRIKDINKIRDIKKIRDFKSDIDLSSDFKGDFGNKFDPKIPDFDLPRPKIPDPIIPDPDEPTIKIPFLDNDNFSKLLKPPQFAVDTREGGKWTKLKGGFSDAYNALTLGRRAVDNSKAASFRVRGEKGTPNPKFNQFSAGEKFRLPKRGNKFLDSSNVLIEKRNRRIDTPGEVAGISAKGWLANRQKRRRGFFL